MNDKELQDILSHHKLWLESNGTDGKRADLRYADLHGEDLQDANLKDADLTGANLDHADLHGANLQCADLRYADLHGANLRGANLDHANLQDADLHYASLRYANLRGADIDYSCIPLWCGSLDVIIDKRIAAQLMYHTLRAMESCADDPDVAAVLASLPVVSLANQFHRIGECGAIRVRNNEGGAE